MIHFMLNNLRRPAGKVFRMRLHFKCLELHFNFLYRLHFRGPPRRDRHPSSVSYAPSFLMISGLSITVYVGARPLSSRKAIIRLNCPIILAAIPTHPSLCAISVSSKSCAIYKSSAVAASDFLANKIVSCIISLTITYTFLHRRIVVAYHLRWLGSANSLLWAVSLR